MKISLIENHDYLSVVTPNGRFTLNRSGYKASGLMCNQSVFNNMVKHVEDAKSKGLNNIEAMKTLLDEKTMSNLFPEWNKKAEKISVGDTVRLTDLFGQKYPNTYKVVEVKRKNAFLDLDGRIVGIDSAYMELVKK